MNTANLRKWLQPLAPGNSWKGKKPNTWNKQPVFSDVVLRRWNSKIINSLLKRLTMNCLHYSGSSLHPVLKLQPGRWRWHPGPRRNCCVRGELLHQTWVTLGLLWTELWRCFFLHSLLEWLNPKALHWEDNAEEEAAAAATSPEGEKVRANAKILTCQVPINTTNRVSLQVVEW